MDVLKLSMEALKPSVNLRKSAAESGSFDMMGSDLKAEGGGLSVGKRSVALK